MRSREPVDGLDLAGAAQPHGQHLGAPDVDADTGCADGGMCRRPGCSSVAQGHNRRGEPSIDAPSASLGRSGPVDQTGPVSTGPVSTGPVRTVRQAAGGRRQGRLLGSRGQLRDTVEREPAWSCGAAVRSCAGAMVQGCDSPKQPLLGALDRTCREKVPTFLRFRDEIGKAHRETAHFPCCPPRSELTSPRSPGTRHQSPVTGQQAPTRFTRQLGSPLSLSPRWRTGVGPRQLPRRR